MKIKTRLTLWFSVVAASILLIFAAVVYWSSAQNRKTEFYEELEKEAITKAKVFLEAKVKPSILHKIYKNNSEIINEVEVALYDYDFNLLYHDAVEIDRVKETPELIDEIIKNKKIRFFQDKWQVIGFSYSYGNQNYIITATALDEYGYTKLENLLYTSLILVVIGLVFIYFAGVFFAQKILQPLQNINREIDKIKASNLDMRISVENQQDELAELVGAFNDMLDRLEHSFVAQKQFVSNISHELRTPLAAVITETELALSKEQDKIYYVETLRNTLSDAKKIVRLSDSLLDFAKASYDPEEINFKSTRMDEVILNACQKLQKANPSYTFNFVIDESLDREELLSVNGNPYLLEVAVLNLLENACKFSKDRQCKVKLSYHLEKLKLMIIDNGEGISPEDLTRIFIPFFRGKNKNYTGGNGIGLALTKKIIDLHKAKIYVDSEVGKGTIFSVYF